MDTNLLNHSLDCALQPSATESGTKEAVNRCLLFASSPASTLSVIGRSLPHGAPRAQTAGYGCSAKKGACSSETTRLGQKADF